MKKQTIIIILVSIILGFLVGTNQDIFLPKKTALPPVYPPKVPQELIKESEAFSDIVKALGPSVVNISTTKIKKSPSPFSPFFEDSFRDFFGEHFRLPKKWKERSLGSGVIVSEDGYIITNNHVVEKADEIKITLFDKRELKGKIVGSDPKTDIAILKISAQDLPSIPWGDSDKLQVGEFVLAFGNPFGLSHTVTMGIISALGRANVGIADYEDFIQTDAAINPGNSGGPLVNIKGELIGINTAIFSRTGGYQGIGFAVPSNMARSIMEHLIKNGKVIRGWLGITIQRITPELAKEFALKTLKGTLVSDVSKDSPAEKAGLKRGDVIQEINNKEIEDIESLRNMVAQSEVGSTIKLKVVRDGKTIFLNATVGEMSKELVKSVPEKIEESAEQNILAGFSVTDLTPEIAKQLGLSREEKGVVIVRVKPESAAEEAELKRGDVIQEINRKKINNSKDFSNIVSRIKEGDTVLLFVNRGGKKFYTTLKAFS